MDTRESKCLLCSLGCDIAFRVKGEAVVGPEFLSTDGPSGTRVCARGLYGSELLSHPQRVATPLIRRDGVLRESSWDAAIDTVGAAIRNVVEAYGPGAVAIVTEATRSSEELEAVALLARSIGTGAVSCVFEPQDWPLVARESSAGVASIQEANCVIVLGDVFFTHPVIAKEIIDAKYTARGNSLFVVDPRKSNTAWYASEHVRNRPGTEALVLACILKALKTVGRMSSDSHSWLDSVDEKALLETAGVARDTVARIARAFSDAGKAAVVVAPPVRGMNDVALVARLATLIAEVLGEQKACVLLPSGGNVRGARAVAAKYNWRPVSTLTADLEAGRYRALVSFGADLLASFPSAALTHAVSGLDCVVSFSLFTGDIENASSVVLAGASWLEADGTGMLFDDALIQWKGVGSTSWGTRALPEVAALIGAAVGQPGQQPGRAHGGDARADMFDTSESGLAARVEAVRAMCAAPVGGDLALVTLPASGHAGAGVVTGWMQWAREVFPTGFCEISTQDAAALDIVEGEAVVVDSPSGQLELRARLTDRLQKGVIAVPGYDAAVRTLFSWQVGADGWFSTGPGTARVRRER